MFDQHDTIIASSVRRGGTAVMTEHITSSDEPSAPVLLVTQPEFGALDLRDPDAVVQVGDAERLLFRELGMAVEHALGDRVVAFLYDTDDEVRRGWVLLGGADPLTSNLQGDDEEA